MREGTRAKMACIVAKMPFGFAWKTPVIRSWYRQNGYFRYRAGLSLEGPMGACVVTGYGKYGAHCQEKFGEKTSGWAQDLVNGDIYKLKDASGDSIIADKVEVETYYKTPKRFSNFLPRFNVLSARR